MRTLVAKRDWWASLKVVSISRSPLCFLTALAKPSGPSATKMSRKPRGGSVAEKQEKENILHKATFTELINALSIFRSAQSKINSA